MLRAPQFLIDQPSTYNVKKSLRQELWRITTDTLEKVKYLVHRQRAERPIVENRDQVSESCWRS